MTLTSSTHERNILPENTVSLALLTRYHTDWSFTSIPQTSAHAKTAWHAHEPFLTLNVSFELKNAR